MEDTEKMLIKRKVVTGEPPVIVDRTTNREVVVNRDSQTGLAVAIVCAVLVVAGLIGYFAWWSPSRTDVVVTPSSNGSAAQPMAPNPSTTIVTPPTIVSPPPVVNTPPVVVNPSTPAPVQHDKTVIIEHQQEKQTPPPAENESGSGTQTTGSEEGSSTDGQ
jgi:hypothetical protein